MRSAVLLEPPLDKPDTPKEVYSSSVASTRTRVLHLINGEHYAGAERVQDLLAGALPSFGFDVGLACLKPNRFPEARTHREAPLYELPMQGRFDLRPVRQLVRIVRGEGYSLVHAHTPRALLIGGLACWLTGVPLVYHVHSPASRDSTRRWQNRVNALVERLFLRVACVLLTVSHSLREHVLGQGVSVQKVLVVPNGVPRRTPRPERRQSQSLWTIGTVALFRPRKGVEILLEALAILRARGLPVQLRAVGGFETLEYECEVQHLAEQLGLTDVICWTGFTHDVDRELAQMDIFVLPSLFGEGLPMVVLEAMASGVPVVATRVGGIPEAIQHGRDGLLVAAGDPANLACALASLIRGEVDWLRLRQSALDRHGREFSDRSMAEGVAGVYRRVLNQPAKKGGPGRAV